jgi:RNA polymerase sigma-70 factor (ECF subfamily)
MPVTSFRVLAGGPPVPDDAAVVAALRQGDAGADLAAWNRFSPSVDATVRRLLGPAPDAEREDLVQEVFIRFFRGVRRLREPAAVRGFLVGICLRVVRGEIAARRRRSWLRLTPTGDTPERAGDERDDEAREAVRRYYRVLDRLPGQERSIFVARTIEGLTLDEVARAHEISVSTAQRRIERATERVTRLVQRDPLLARFVEEEAP